MLVYFFGRKIHRSKKLLKFALEVCRQVSFLKKQAEVSFIFVSDIEIRKINQKFLNHHYFTDVISFSYPLPPNHSLKKEKNFPLGDIYISVDTAARQSREGGHFLFQELALLIVHGLLHLAGYDDQNPADKKRMFARQKQLLKKIDPSLTPKNI